MFENEITPDRAFLICADIGEYDAEKSLEELYELARTANAETVGTAIQKRDSYDTATCIGKGRLEEITQQIEALDVNLLIFDCELSGSQIRNIENETGIRTIDRTTLILDIFAQRAVTREGKVQVELAQQKYRLPRLGGQGKVLSRLGGGIGTRGPGETKLEADKRHIRSRINALEDELRELEKHRKFLRARRKKDNVLTAAIVGYTNVGKSTLLNKLTDANVLAENKLFATLDIVSRGIELPDGRTVLLTDTVGLISRLPHHLVEAFKSTLEEASAADIIIHVIDASSEDCLEQTKVTEKLLSELGCDGIPVVCAFNKCDESAIASQIEEDSATVKISAKTGFGLERLCELIAKNLENTGMRLKLLVPYDNAGLLAKIRENGKVYEEEYRENGIFADAFVDKALVFMAKPYIYEEV
ncbi:MAG: GTPase HflX [Oscillospiraceae bacterium]|nr:GTPase HflX [Oscillospiraceae bacterium]